MPRYDDRYGGNTRLYVGRLSSRTRTRDLEDLFSRYGRVRYVDMKHEFAFVEFSDSRDADEARYNLDGQEFDGSRMIVEFAKGVPRGPGGSREYMGRGPPPGSGRCFNCGIDGHWARDCEAGDWKNRCYRCGDRGHIERDCRNSPKNLRRGRSYSRSPSPRRGRSRDRSYSRSRSRSYSRSRSPRRNSRDERRSMSPRDSRSPRRSPRDSRSPRRSPLPSKGRERSPSPNGSRSPAPREHNGADCDISPRRADSRSPANREHHDASPAANGRSPSPGAYKDNGNHHASPRGKGTSHGHIGEVPVGHTHILYLLPAGFITVRASPMRVQRRRQLMHQVQAADVGEVEAAVVLQPQHELQAPHDVLHRRPVRAALREALGRRLPVLPQRLRPHRRGDTPVDDLVQLAPALPVQGPLHQVHHRLGEPGVHDGARAQRLQEHDAEGVDVGLGRQLPGARVVRVHVPEAALHGRADVRLAQLRPGLGQPEVGDLGGQAAVQQDVGRLHVAVDHRLGQRRVQVEQAPRRARAGLQPLRPAERALRRGRAAVQPAPERALLHVLVQQDHLVALVAPTRGTRWRWRRPDSSSISVRNSRAPCRDSGLARFTATLVPSGSIARYTFPNPPAPMTRLSSKLSVASWSMANGKR
ncbi:LOW QUALITY PROTEIN: hypothetical protein U9M48_020839 [Paspalum notatum var. saurae]